MRWLVLVLLGTAAQAFEFDQDVRVPAAGFEVVQLAVKGRPAWLDLNFRVLRGGPAVRLALLPATEERRFRAGRPVDEIATTTFEREGHLRAYIRVPGNYVVLIDNRPNPRRAARVRLQGTVEYDRSTTIARQLSPARRFAVVGVSLGIFFGVVWIAGGRLWGATVTRRKTGPPPPSE